jgi:hypothetical protein
MSKSLQKLTVTFKIPKQFYSTWINKSRFCD